MTWSEDDFLNNTDVFLRCNKHSQEYKTRKLISEYEYLMERALQLYMFDVYLNLHVSE